MQLIANLYTRALGWARHKHAPWFLAGVSFAEASFFLVPPDVLLIPMALAKPERAWRYALLTMLTSVAGSLLGYALGFYFFALLKPLIAQMGYLHAYAQVMHWFHAWGVWVILLAGFTPLPYKLFTIGAGAFALPLLPFIVVCCIGRSLRFFLVAGAMRLGGARLEARLLQFINRWSYWVLLGLGLILCVWLLV